jgi:DNA-binding IclR family transcriptional regulator
MTSTDIKSKVTAPAVRRSNVPSTASGKLLGASSETHNKQNKTASSTTTTQRMARKTDTATTPASQAGGDARAIAPADTPRQTKASVVEGLLAREGGVSLEALCEATGWQAHTCRAFLTGLRKKGREIVRASDKAGKSFYLIAPEQTDAPMPVTAKTQRESN